jgi:hypothetical protein
LDLQVYRWSCHSFLSLNHRAAAYNFEEYFVLVNFMSWSVDVSKRATAYIAASFQLLYSCSIFIAALNACYGQRNLFEIFKGLSNKSNTVYKIFIVSLRRSCKNALHVVTSVYMRAIILSKGRLASI